MLRFSKNTAYLGALVCLAGLTGGGCGGGSNIVAPVVNASPSPIASPDTGRVEAVTAPRQVDGLVFTLSSPQVTYRTGQAIPYELRVTNTKAESVTVFYIVLGDTDTAFYNEQGTSVVGYGHGGGLVERMIVFAPGETKTFARIFNEYGTETALPAGKYQIESWVTGSLSGYDFYYGNIPVLKAERLSIEITE